MRQPDGPALASRHRRVRARLEAAGVEALVVTTPNSIRYLSNHVGTAGVLVLPLSGELVLLVDGRYTEAVTARQQTATACPGLEVVPVPGSYEEALVECVGRLGPERIGFEAAHLTVSKFLWLEKALRDRQRGTLIPTYDLLDDVRAVKDELEIALLRDAAARLTGVADAVWPQVRAGLSERDVAGFVEQALRAAGFERPAFDVIAASGPNSALPHHRAGERRLSHGDPLVLDFGGVLDGYCSDVTRTVSIGPASPEVRRLHAAVHEAHDAAIAAVRPGVLTSDVDAAARNVLERHGLGAAFVHGTGHGLGLDVHEAPRVARPRPDLPPTRLDAGMVITVEPGVYIPGVGGVRIEDDILVTGTGADVLTSVPSALVALGGTWT